MKSALRLPSLFFLLAAGLSAPARAEPADWTADALRLSGASERVYLGALRRLRATPQLEQKLRAALGFGSTRTFLALDVISTLKLEALFPDLIAASKLDTSGFFYLAINTFIDPAHRERIAALYQERLGDAQASAAVKVVLLDTLARLHAPVATGLLRGFLFDDGEPELRSAALYFIRAFLRRGDGTYRALLAEVVRAHPRASGDGAVSGPFSAQLGFLLAELSRAGGAGP